MIKYILTFAMLLTWGSTAWISIKALVQFLPNSGFIVYVIGLSLELGKTVSLVFIHRTWNNTKAVTKIYYSMTILILVLLTACEVTGYLSNAHRDSILNYSKIEMELNLIHREKEFLKHQIDLIEKNLNDFPKGYGSKRIEIREKSQLDKKLEKMNELLNRESRLSVAGITSEIESPIFATTKLFKINPQKTASFFIIVLVCVLEMMSNGLTLAVSHLWQKKLLVSKTGNQENIPLLKDESAGSDHAKTPKLTELKRDSELKVFFHTLLEKYDLTKDKIISITGKSKSATVESWITGDTEIPLKELYKITNYIGTLKQNPAT